MKNLITLLALITLMSACSTGNYTRSSDDETANVQDNTLDLTTRIKMLAGVIVRGERGNATISVGGPGSLYGDTTPLFVLDGTPVESYASLYSMVNSADIKRVVLLRDPVDLAFYGNRGANGVIKITMKKG